MNETPEELLIKNIRELGPDAELEEHLVGLEGGLADYRDWTEHGARRLEVWTAAWRNWLAEAARFASEAPESAGLTGRQVDELLAWLEGEMETADRQRTVESRNAVYQRNANHRFNALRDVAIKLAQLRGEAP